MSERTSSQPPLLVIAALAALVAVVLGIALWRELLPATWGTALQWGLAAASFTFTVVHLIHTRRVTAGELRLLALAPCSLISHYFVIAAAVFLVIWVVHWIIDDLS